MHSLGMLLLHRKLLHPYTLGSFGQYFCSPIHLECYITREFGHVRAHMLYPVPIEVITDATRQEPEQVIIVASHVLMRGCTSILLNINLSLNESFENLKDCQQLVRLSPH